METDDYRLTEWKGLDNWQCKHCPYSTVNGLGEMLGHLVKHGLPQGQPLQVDPQGADEEE
jgi:hypothetical protein